MATIALLLVTAATALAAPYQSGSGNCSVSFYVAVQSSGIVRMAFDPSKDVNHSLSIEGEAKIAGDKPGWITAHRDNLYSISRTHYPDNGSVSGGIFAFQLPNLSIPERMNLTLLDSVSSEGEGGVHCDVNTKGTLLSAADIDGSSVSVHALAQDGRISSLLKTFHYNLSHPGPGTNGSQIISNPHQALFDPSGRLMVVPDRGGDRVYMYSVHDPTAIHQVANISLPPGTGPRHALFRQSNTTTAYMYLVGELDNTVRVYTVAYGEDSANSSCRGESSSLQEPIIQLRQTISTLGANRNRTAPDNHDIAAEIAVTNDGKFLYASNRNTISLKSDTIAIFSINDTVFQHVSAHAEVQHLTYLGFNETLGKIPRHFALSKDDENRWLAVANEVSQDIQVFERNRESGFMSKRVGGKSLGSSLDLNQEYGPTCVLWA